MTLQDELATFSLNINREDKAPLFTQVANQIRQLIFTERLRCDDRLPSSRKLAEILGISRTSTLNAYEQLISEGLLVTRSTAGIYVTALGAVKSTITNHKDQQIESLWDTEAESNDSTNAAFDSGVDVSQFPFIEWSRSLSRVWRNPDPVLLSNRLAGGYYPLRQAVSHFVKVVRGINCRPEQVIITAGSRDAMTLISHVLLQYKDKVALENPCYPPIKHLLQKQGSDIHLCEIDSEGMQLPVVGVKMAIMTPACQYPLSVIQSIQRRLQWLEYSQQNECWIIEDDFDSEFHYRKTPLATIFSMEENSQPEGQRKVILAGSFSQLMFRTLRIGYLIVPIQLINDFLSAQKKLGTMASLPIQPALADFISHKRFARYLRRMRLQNQQRRDLLFDLVQEHLTDFFKVEIADCGTSLHLLMNTGFKITDTEIERQLKHKGVHVSALSSHYQSSERQGLMLGFSGSDEDKFQQGIITIKNFVRDFCVV